MRMNRIFSVFPGWGWSIVLLPFCLVFFYAPLAFGGTVPSAVVVIDCFAVISFTLWLCLLGLQRRLPRISLVCLLSLCFLLIFGLLSSFNPRAVFQRDLWMFFSLEGSVNWLPGTVYAETTIPIVRHFVAMLFAFLVVHDASRFDRPRWYLLRMIAYS